MKLLVLAEIKWSYFMTRKQQLFSRFSKNYEILFCEPYRRGAQNEPVPFHVKENIEVVTIPFLKNVGGALGKIIGRLRGAAFLAGKYWLKLVLQRSGFSVPEVVIFSNLYAVPLLDLFGKETLLIYDMNDNHTAFQGCPLWLFELRQRACERADLIVVSNPALEELVPAAYRKNKICYIGNGVDLSIPNRILS